jgi:hypothetical protein
MSPSWRIPPPAFFLLAVLSFMVLACRAAAAPAGEWALVYEETFLSPGAAPAGGEVHVRFTPEQTMIEDRHGHLHIDYRQLSLERQPLGQVVVRYTLQPAQPAGSPSSPGRAIAAMLAEYRVERTGRRERIGPLPAEEKMIWFGAGLSRSRTMAPVTLEAFGMVMGERRWRCWVSEGRHEALRRIAEERRQVVLANPLLLQVDPVNLVLVLEGLPLRIEESEGARVRVLALRSITVPES